MDKVPLAQVEEKTPEAEPMPVKEGPEQDLKGIGENIEYHRVADFLDLSYSERQDPNLAEKVDLLYRWGQDTSGSEERIDALMAIKNLIKGMGITDKGQEMIKKVYKWIRLDNSRKKIEKEMELINER